MRIATRPPRSLAALMTGAFFLAMAALPTGASAEETTTEANTDRPTQIQWFGTWEQAKAEAAKTGMPILLTSAAPHCRGVSGMW